MSQTLTYVMGADRRVHVKDIQDFKIDFSDDNHNWVQARQFERGMRQVFVNIVNEDGTPFDLTGCNVWFEGLLPKTADGDFRVIDTDGYVPLDPSAGKFRFDMPGHAFTVAGSYRQAFFRIVKNGNSVTTLEFDLDVLADKVIDGLVPKDWIGPFEKIADQLVDSLQKHTDDADKILADFQKKVGDLIAQLNQQGSTTTSMLTELQNRIADLEEKIKQDNLVTQPQLDALKQLIVNMIKANTINVFHSVEEMKNSADSLTEGMTIRTLGYYQANDAGAATYHVTSKPNTSRHYETLGNSLYAELIDDHYNLAMRGAKTDGSEDISQIFNEAVKEALANDGDKTIRLPAGTFLLTNSVTLPIRSLSLIGENGTTLLTDTGNDPAMVLYGPDTWAGVRRSIVDINFREKHDKAAGTKAVLIGDEQFIADKTPLQAAAQFEFEKCGFTNYDIGIAVGSDAYLFDFIDCSCTHLNRFISTISSTIMNAGEKIGIANCILTACSDTVFYLENMLELHVTNSSIDSLEGGKVLYVCDPEYSRSIHLISFDDCHFEPGDITKPIFKITGEHTHCDLEIENSVFWLNKVSADSLIDCGDLINTINFRDNFVGTSEDKMTFIANNSNATITNTSLDASIKPIAFSQNISGNHRNRFKNATLDGVTDLISNVAYGVGNVYSIQRDDSDFSNGPRITTTNAKMSIDSEVPQGMTGRSIKIDASGQGIFNFDFMAPLVGTGILEFALYIKSNVDLSNVLSCYHLSSDGNEASSFEFPFSKSVQCSGDWEQDYFTSAPYKLRGEQSFAGFRLVLDKRQLGDAVTIKIYNPYVNVI